MDIRSECVLVDVKFNNNIPADLVAIVEDSLEECKINVIKKDHHIYDNGGMTSIYLLSASLLAIHTWPEANYVSLDIYTCSGEGSAVEVSNSIIKSFNGKIDKIKIKKVFRGEV